MEKLKNRKRVLLAFLDTIGGRLKDIGDLRIDYRPREFPSTRELYKRMREWIHDSDQIEKDCPRFLKSVGRLLQSQLGFDYNDAYFDATCQRMMLLAFYVGYRLKLSEAEIMDLVKKAKETVFT